MKENRKLRNLLIMQSFLPLTVLLFIKHFKISMCMLVFDFTSQLFHGDLAVFRKALEHESFLIFIVLTGCVFWFIRGILSVYQFRNVQNANFIEGDKITVNSISSDSGLIFFVTFIVPLVMDNIGKANEFLVFICLTFMVILLMNKSNLYYQNPVLTILGYTTFQFEFVTKSGDSQSKKDLIGLTYGKIDENKIIKYQLISDNVYLVYNRNTTDSQT